MMHGIYQQTTGMGRATDPYLNPRIVVNPSQQLGSWEITNIDLKIDLDLHDILQDTRKQYTTWCSHCLIHTYPSFGSIGLIPSNPVRSPPLTSGHPRVWSPIARVPILMVGVPRDPGLGFLFAWFEYCILLFLSEDWALPFSHSGMHPHRPVSPQTYGCSVGWQ